MLGSHEINGVLRPTQDWVILSPERVDETSGGIHLPDAARQFGKCPVLAAGPDASLKEGDVVWMQRFVEGEFKFVLNGKRAYAIRERHINVAIGKKGKLRAVGDRILVRRIEKKDVVVDGIYIPETAAEKTQECEVVSLGAKAPKAMKVGDRLLIARYSGAEVEHEGDRFTIVNENDVVAIFGAG